MCSLPPGGAGLKKVSAAGEKHFGELEVETKRNIGGCAACHLASRAQKKFPDGDGHLTLS